MATDNDPQDPLAGVRGVYRSPKDFLTAVGHQLPPGTASPPEGDGQVLYPTRVALRGLALTDMACRPVDGVVLPKEAADALEALWSAFGGIDSNAPSWLGGLGISRAVELVPVASEVAPTPPATPPHSGSGMALAELSQTRPERAGAGPDVQL